MKQVYRFLSLSWYGRLRPSMNPTSMTPHLCRTLGLLSPSYTSRFQTSPVFSSVSFLLFSSSASSDSKADVLLSDYLINKHQFSEEAVLKASSRMKYLKQPQNCDSVLLFLKEFGFSKPQVEDFVQKRPSILSANIEVSIKPKIEILKQHGFSLADIAGIVLVDPWLFRRSVEKLGPTISALKSVLGSNDAVLKVLKWKNWFLQTDLNKTLLPNVSFLKNCGISEEQIIRFVHSFPRLFLCAPERMEGYVRMAEEMGADRKSKQFLSAVRTLSSMSKENWQQKLELFRSLGYSEDDIIWLFKRQPQVFAVSVSKIKKVAEMFISRKDVDHSFIVKHPELLIYSVEKRIKPRLHFFDILNDRDLCKNRFSLTRVIKLPTSEFLVKCVVPYAKELKGLQNILPAKAVLELKKILPKSTR